jgi:hypothetical protein
LVDSRRIAARDSGGLQDCARREVVLNSEMAGEEG